MYSKHISVAENCKINGLGNFIVEDLYKKFSSCGVRDLYWMQKENHNKYSAAGMNSWEIRSLIPAIFWHFF